MPIIDRRLGGEAGESFGMNQIIGYALPAFRLSYSNNITYKRLSLYALVDGTYWQSLYNQSEGWGLLDFASSRFDGRDLTVETAKPVGYEWRGGPSESTGIGGVFDVVGAKNYVLPGASYAQIPEGSATYRVGPGARTGGWAGGVFRPGPKTGTR